MDKILSSKRLEWLDAIKGIGILLIMACHAGLLPRISFLLTAGYISIFFVASGYTYKAKDSFKEEISKRCKRLLFPYFFWVSLSLVMLYVLNIKQNILSGIYGMLYSRYSLYFGMETPNDVLLLPFTGNTPPWFLTGLFVALMFMYFLRRANTILIVIFCIALSMIAVYIPVLLPWSIDTALIGTLQIYTGIQIRGGQLKTINKWSTFLMMVCFYLVLLAFDRTNNISVRIYGNHEPMSVITYTLIGVIEFSLMRYVFKLFESRKVVRWLAEIGRLSLVLMCIHDPINSIFKSFFYDGKIIMIISYVVIIELSFLIRILSKKINKPLVSYLLGI